MSTERHVIGACPLDCPDGCSWVVTVRDKVAVKLRGNRQHRMTNGGLCKKVYPWLDYAKDPGRLLTPLRRVTPKASSSSIRSQSNAFVAISWEEALGEIAERLNTVRASSGAQAIWPFTGTGNMGFIQGASGPAGDRLWNHLGASDHDLTICAPSGHIGLGYTMGTAAGMDPEDTAHAGVVLIWGANPVVSGQHWWPFVEQARTQGSPVIVIDPTYTRTAARADYHIGLLPGTDAALALGLCARLIERGEIDHDYVARHTLGFAGFEASLAPWTPEHTAHVCGIDVADFEQLVDTIATHSPLTLKFGHGAQRHAGGGQAARAVSCVPALLGSFAHLGGGMFYSTGDTYELNVDEAAGKALGSRPRSLAMTNLVENLTRLDPAVEALIISGANPVVSNPDTEGVKRALLRQDLFTVAIELFHTETTDYADLVLPSTMAHEHLDLNNSFVHTYLNLNSPAVEPPGQCLAHTEIYRRLARAMGLSEPALFATDEELLDCLVDTPGLSRAGVDAAYLRQHGFVRMPNAARPYQPFLDRFPTPSGRFEFESSRAAEDGFGLVPNFTRAVEAGTGVDEVGFYDLVAAASDWHINSTFAGTEVVAKRTSAPHVTINPVDAERDALMAGQQVTVENQRGSFDATLAVETTARRGTAVCTKGWWGQGLNATVAERDSDMGRGAVFHDNRVRIAATEADRQ